MTNTKHELAVDGVEPNLLCTTSFTMSNLHYHQSHWNDVYNIQGWRKDYQSDFY